ncbi:MAG TPA: hypothetical protein VIM59_03095 [Cellvibrio sp.]
MNSSKHLPVVLSILVLTACGDKAASPAATEIVSSENVASSATASSESTAIPVATSSAQTDAWIGKWNGPEGTSIEISGAKGSYIISIEDLDSVKQYTGTSNGTQITFERDGNTEILQASNGADTGMKWLAEKSNCLRVRLGEGWCRD